MWASSSSCVAGTRGWPLSTDGNCPRSRTRNRAEWLALPLPLEVLSPPVLPDSPGDRHVSAAFRFTGASIFSTSCVSRGTRSVLGERRYETWRCCATPRLIAVRTCPLFRQNARLAITVKTYYQRLVCVHSVFGIQKHRIFGHAVHADDQALGPHDCSGRAGTRDLVQ